LVCASSASELHRRRPPPRQLTTFYFCLAAGGALGAILVGVVAPLVLPGNYDLTLGVCAPSRALGVAVTWAMGWFARVFSFALSALMAMLVVFQVRDDRTNALVRVRNFYGTLHVTQVDDEELHAITRTLYHGVIMHGRRCSGRTCERFRPRITRTNRASDSRSISAAISARGRVGIIGLGAGTIAAYGRPGDVFRFYTSIGG